MAIIVTGGAGFIGSHLCERLLRCGQSIICLDNLLTGTLENIKPFMLDDDFTFVQHDVTQPYFTDEKVDHIYHLASAASPRDYLEYPIQTLKAGALGTLNMLGLAKAKHARFLLASTSEVYGDPLISPQVEEYNGNVDPIGLRGVYDEAKRYAEALTMAYQRSHGVETRIARIFNTYGPRMRLNDGRAVPNFIGQALRNEPLTIYGDGYQTRSLCYISDMVDGLLQLMKSDVGTPINLGNPEEVTILALAKLIRELCKSYSTIVNCPRLPSDPQQRKPDISKAQQFLHWQPRVSLKIGLAKTIEWYLR